MKRFLFVPCTLILLAGCSKEPYKVLDRSTESIGLVIKIRAEVPADATKEQVQSWCNTITADEKTEGIVSTGLVVPQSTALI